MMVVYVWQEEVMRYIYIILEACSVCFGCFSGSTNKSAATFCSLGMPIFSALAFLFVRSLIYLSHGAEFVILRNSLLCLWEKILLLCIQGFCIRMYSVSL